MIKTSGSRVFSGIFLLLFLLATRGQVAAQKLEKMRVGYNAITGSNSALWISKEAGLTAKNGLDVEFIYIESGSRITQAMLAGDLRLGNTGSGSSIQARAKGADTVIILSVMPTVPFQVVARAEIRKPEDLRGKKFAISTFGSTTDFGARYFLEKAGLKVGKDIIVLQGGGQSTRLAALKQGVVDATLLGAPTLLVAKQLGLNVLADLVDLGFHYDFGSIATARSFIESNRDAVRRFVRAYVEGVHYFKTHAEESKKIMARYLRENEPAVLEETYTYYADKTAATPYPTRDGIEPVINQILAASKTEKTKLTFEDVADQSFVRELDRNGFIQSLYRK
ncbi:MAG TPA: ABC transporter substrate-binding protein [Candidatus Binatia bacterium]